MSELIVTFPGLATKAKGFAKKRAKRKIFGIV